MSYFQPYLPNFSELAALLACALVVMGFLAVGSALIRSERPGLAALLAGWGVTAAAPALLQWLVPVDLGIYAAVAGGLALAAALLNRRVLAGSTLWRPAVLLGPVLIVACGVPLDQWDSFSHWGLNAAWLWRFDALPTPGLPVSPSSNPDYPYAYPLALYFASLLRGAYIENAGGMVNVMVLVGVSATLARLASGDDLQRFRSRPWYWSAWGVLATLVLNPGLVRSTTLATYADTAFSACLLALGLAIWRLSEVGRERWSQPWVATAALAVMLVGVKESGLIALGVIATAIVVLAARDAAGRAALGRTLGALVPAAFVGFAWQQYTAGWLPSSFAILALDQWRLDLLPALFRSAGAEVADHGLFYLMLAGVVVLGARGWWRMDDRVDRFASLAALVVLGHHGTVLLAYMGASFTEAEVARAASFHRYSTQVGLLALGALTLVIGRWAALRARDREATGRRAPGRWPIAACVIVLAAGSPYLHRERSDYESFYLQHGRILSDELPAGSRVGLLGWQELPYAYFLLRYEFFRPGRGDRQLVLERVFEPLARRGPERGRQLERLTRRKALSHVLIIGDGLQGEDSPDMLLLARDGATWQRRNEWRSK